MHDDHRRVGEVAILTPLMGGEPVPISRLEPFFGAQGSARRPLADPHLSRKPFYLKLKADGIEIDLSATSTPIFMHGEPLAGRRLFTTSEVEGGVVLQLANSIVLLLHLRDPVPERAGETFGLVGQSEAIHQLRRDIDRVASLDVPVLLRGETGTGKEMVARAVHCHGPRRNGPLVAVNLAAVPASLAASELFGAAKGAFTGAVASREGHFGRAHGGTLFLDEIGETPLEVQPLLLRALETGEIQGVGEAKMRRVDVRLVAATDADLEKEIAEGRFRAPLLHRLSGFGIFLPPLRTRRDDLGLLLIHFIRQALREMGEEVSETRSIASVRPWLRASLVAMLAEHAWPGNVRELRNVARQLLIVARDARPREVQRRAQQLLEAGKTLSDDPTSSPTSDPTGPNQGDPAHATSRPGRFRPAQEVGEDEVLAALKANRWLIQPTAGCLGISRTALYRLIDKSSRIRKPSELGRTEIESSLARCLHDVEKAADELEVSVKGLRLRMRQLDI